MTAPPPENDPGGRRLDAWARSLAPADVPPGTALNAGERIADPARFLASLRTGLDGPRPTRHRTLRRARRLARVLSPEPDRPALPCPKK